MDDDTFDARLRYDNVTTDPAKRELFRLLYQIDRLHRTHAQALPAAAQAELRATIEQALEAVRVLPDQAA